MMRTLFGLTLAGALALGNASDAKAQFSLSIGNPYTGQGVAIGNPYGLGYGYGGLGYGGLGYGGYSPYGYSAYSSAYSGLGVAPMVNVYSSGYRGLGYGAPVYGGYGYRAPVYRTYGYRVPFYRGYGYGGRRFRRW